MSSEMLIRIAALCIVLACAETLHGIARIKLLIPRIDKPGRVAAFEIMINTPSIAALIRDNKTFRIQSDIQTGSKYGMITLDAWLMNKYQQGMIAREEVITKAADPTTILAKLQELDLEQSANTGGGKK